MYFMALATDYDGTLAEDGRVSDATIAALESFRETGRKLIMVTGRELPDLKRVFDRLDLFEKVVVENGALLYTPATEEERPLSLPPAQEFVAALEQRGVEPLSVGRSIVATWEPHETTVLEVIHELGLELEIVFNKGAVMVLPSGINKASGLTAALAELRLAPLNVVGVGDAENDHAFLTASGLSVAVANAIPALKDRVDLVLDRPRGDGVQDLIGRLVGEEHTLTRNLRHSIRLGTADDGAEVSLQPNDVVLISGSSGIGKSTLATALTERFVESGFQFCVLDPEGDYDELENAITTGDAENAPIVDEVLELLDQPDENVVVNALALQVKERPGFFVDLQSKMASLRRQYARPHWLILDEAHHLMPASRDGTSLALPDSDTGTIMITVHPDSIAPKALANVKIVLALGPQADEVITRFCDAVGEAHPLNLSAPEGDKVLFWHRDEDGPRAISVDRPRQSHKRHTRKYAEGHLDEQRSFYFRGPNADKNIRAHNLAIFVQIAEGIDDPTWEYHLRRGDYSRWFRDLIRDEDLATETAQVEEDQALSPAESRRAVADFIRRRYTAPASK